MLSYRVHVSFYQVWEIFATKCLAFHKFGIVKDVMKPIGTSISAASPCAGVPQTMKKPGREGLVHNDQSTTGRTGV